MTNYEKIISEMTIDKLEKYMQETYCKNGICTDCPIYNDCDYIYGEVCGSGYHTCEDVVKPWLQKEIM